MTAPRVLAGRYELQRRLGAGGAGEVWLARDTVLARPVAVKLLRAEHLESASVREHIARLHREARLAARLHHPNAVAVYDVQADGTSPFVVMEYVPGQSLAGLLTRVGRLDPEHAAAVVTQVAGALAAAHQLGIVHRDVKPANVLLDRDGNAKLADFGVARGIEDTALTVAGQVLGTVLYLPPEAVSGRASGAPGDVWSLAATWYAAVEGHAPYDRGGAQHVPAVMLRILGEPVPPPRHAGPHTSLLMRMLDRDPARRPTAAQVADGLAPRGRRPLELTRQVPVLTEPPAAEAPAVPRRRNRTRALVIAVAVCAVAAAVIVPVALLRRPGHGASPHPAARTSAAHTGSAPDRVARTLPLPEGYVAGGVSQDGRTLFTIGTDRQKVLPLLAIDPENGSVRSSIDLAHSAADLLVAPTGDRAYVSEFASGSNAVSVAVIDTHTLRLDRQWPVPAVPGTNGPVDQLGNLTLTADGHDLYVSVDGGIAELDTATGALVRHVPLARTLGSLAVSHDGSRLFVIGVFTQGIDVVDVRSGTIVKRIKIAGFPDRAAPLHGALISPDGATVYAYGVNDGTRPDVVAAIDTKSLTSRTITAGSSVAAAELALSPDGRYLYAVDQNRADPGKPGGVRILDTRSGTTRTMTVAADPAGICVSPDGEHVYVLSAGGRSGPSRITVLSG